MAPETARPLDRLYLASGYLAAFCMAMIGVSILGQIAGRFLNFAFDATEISGFFMAASTFLGLAYTFHSGSHIRVNLIVARLPGGAQRAIELWCCGLAAIACAYWCWQSVEMVRVSIEVHDVSPGLMAVPFWIPQIPLALGIALLCVALVDQFVRVARGKRPDFADAEAHALEMVHEQPTTAAAE